MENIVKKQTDKMIDLCRRAQREKFPKPYTITIKDLSKYTLSDLEYDVRDLDDSNAIYIISTNRLLFNKNDIKNAFNEQKQMHFNEFKTDYHISKINDSNNWNITDESNTIIYVGSKETNLKQRLKQHLGLVNKNNRRTYSLYLKDWWKWNSQILIKIWIFDTNFDINLLQIIEDSIWDEYMPLFGKKGATFNKKTTPNN